MTTFGELLFGNSIFCPDSGLLNTNSFLKADVLISKTVFCPNLRLADLNVGFIPSEILFSNKVAFQKADCWLFCNMNEI